MPTAMRPARAATSSNDAYALLPTSGPPLASSRSVAATPEPLASERPYAAVTRPLDVIFDITSLYDCPLPVASSIQYVVWIEHDHGSAWSDAGVLGSKRASMCWAVLAAG